MVNLLVFIQDLIHMYELVLIAAAIVSWVVLSGRVSRRDPRLQGIMQALDAVTVPLFNMIRPWMPNTGVVDLAPLALFVVCIFIDKVVIKTAIEAMI